jgi:hypothetical protein
LLGVEATATERAVRGQGMKAKKDGIYRATVRGYPIYVRVQAEAIAAEPPKANRHVSPANAHSATRRTIESGWRTLAENLAKVGHQHVAHELQLLSTECRRQELRKSSSLRDCRNALWLANTRFLAEISPLTITVIAHASKDRYASASSLCSSFAARYGMPPSQVARPSRALS